MNIGSPIRATLPRHLDGGVGWLLWGVLLLGLALSSSAQVFTNNFADRQFLTEPSGEINTDNSTATLEPGEPRHGGKVGGHSLWISWLAPSNGVMKIETTGSSFDTLLSAYTLSPTNSTNLADLVEIIGADDTEGFELESEVEFGVFAGRRYEIAIDGYHGATGQISFEWDFTPLSNAPPVITAISANQAVRVGDTITLTALVTNAGNATFRWFFNGQELEETDTTLVLPNFQATNVGRYWLRMGIGDDVRLSSRSVELQVNSEGISNTLARPKIFDSLETPLIGESDDEGDNDGRRVTAAARSPVSAAAGAGVGVVRGYNGAQIFDTTYAFANPAEPAHCGVAGGASYWLAYQPPQAGTLRLNTIGSGYDTVMEIYTFDSQLTGFGDLVSLACDNDGGGIGGASRLAVPVVPTRSYLVAVDGVNGARGVAWLNYELDTNQPPVLTGTPASQTVSTGSPVVLTAPVTGTSPLHVDWFKDDAPLPGQQGLTLSFAAVTEADSAAYRFSVTNAFGGPVEGTFTLHVVSPPQVHLTGAPGNLQLNVPTVPGVVYVIEQAPGITGPWEALPGTFVGDGMPLVLPISSADARFYRVRLE